MPPDLFPTSCISNDVDQASLAGPQQVRGSSTEAPSLAIPGQEFEQGCGSGARSIARGITTVFTVLAGASKLVGDLIRSPIHSSVPSINASTPNVRRMSAVSRVNRGRREWAVCSGVVVRIRNSTGAPRLRSVPQFRLLFELGLL